MRVSVNEFKEKWVSWFAMVWMRLRASPLGLRIAELPWWHRWPTRREWLLLVASLYPVALELMH